MTSTLSDRAKSALQKLGDFQCSVIGSSGRISTEYISSEDVPGFGIDWSAYAFKSTWENGWMSIAAISLDEEYMCVYVLANHNSFGDPSPEPIGVPEKEKSLRCEPYDVLLSNLALRLGQIGLPAIESAKHLDHLHDYPLNFYWSEFLGWSNFQNSDIEAFCAVNRTGTKTAVYLFSGEGVKLDSARVRYADQISAEKLPERDQILADFRAVLGYRAIDCLSLSPKPV